MIRGAIGFDGLLLSDDLTMRALAGNLAERTRAALVAGCDIALHCSGQMREMQAVASGASAMSADAIRRFQAGLAWKARRHDHADGKSLAEMQHHLDRLLAQAPARHA